MILLTAPTGQIGHHVVQRMLAVDAPLRAGSFAQGYVDMVCAKNEGMDNVVKRSAESRVPTTFRRWCEEILKPTVTD